MSHAFHAHFRRANFNGHWIGLVITDKVRYFIVKSCAEEDGLSVFLALIENLADGFHEPHVRHAICFIENNYRDIFEGQSSTVKQIVEASRACDKDVNPTIKGLELLGV